MNCGSGGGFGNRNPSIAICFEITDIIGVSVSVDIYQPHATSRI